MKTISAVKRAHAHLMKILFVHIAARLAVAAVCFLLLSGGCSAPEREGFAIYLTKGDISPAQMPALSYVDMAEKPVISISDIVSYDVNTHEITLTADAFDRISNLVVPVRGTSFVVCVDKKLIYWGAFWTPISSLSFDGVTIMKPLGSRDTSVIKLGLGYPGSTFFQGADPRINAEVMESLKKAGKLTGALPARAVDALPHSMKGYELYSWLEDNQWRFTLITGTNRNKTLEEIVSDVNNASENNWVNVHAVGVDAIKSTLSRLPQNEDVVWLSGLRADQTPQPRVNIALPPQATIDIIKEHAGKCSLHMAVHPQ